MEDKDQDLDFPLLDLSSNLSTSVTPRLSVVPLPNPNSSIAPSVDHVMALDGDKVYSTKHNLVPEPMLIEEPDLSPGNEVTTPISFLQDELEHNSFEPKEHDPQPIALRKGTRECTKRPLYPFSHVVSFEKFSPTHRTFLTSLNSIHTPTSLSEALSNENWRQALNVEMQALEKNKIWELVTLPIGK